MHMQRGKYVEKMKMSQKQGLSSRSSCLNSRTIATVKARRDAPPPHVGGRVLVTQRAMLSCQAVLCLAVVTAPCLNPSSWAVAPFPGYDTPWVLGTMASFASSNVDMATVAHRCWVLASFTGSLNLVLTCMDSPSYDTLFCCPLSVSSNARLCPAQLVSPPQIQGLT